MRRWESRWRWWMGSSHVYDPWDGSIETHQKGWVRQPLRSKEGNMRNFSHLKAIHLLSLLQHICYPGNASYTMYNSCTVTVHGNLITSTHFRALKRGFTLKMNIFNCKVSRKYMKLPYRQQNFGNVSRHTKQVRKYKTWSKSVQHFSRYEMTQNENPFYLITTRKPLKTYGKRAMENVYFMFL